MISDRPCSRDDINGDVSDETAKRERRMEQLIDRLPESWHSSARWLRRPSRRFLRISIGVLLIVGSLLAILPVFGLWMLPIGLLLLAEDIPVLRKRRTAYWNGSRYAVRVGCNATQTDRHCAVHRNS